MCVYWYFTVAHVFANIMVSGSTSTSVRLVKALISQKTSTSDRLISKVTSVKKKQIWTPFMTKIQNSINNTGLEEKRLGHL